MYVYNPSNFNVASAAKLATARTINGVAFDGTKNITINAGLSTSSNVTVTSSTQGGINPTWSAGTSGTMNVLNQESGLAAGTYTLQNLLQQLVNRSHTHKLVSRGTGNCNCNCDCSSSH